jgi:hypothetical protein
MASSTSSGRHTGLAGLFGWRRRTVASVASEGLVARNQVEDGSREYAARSDDERIAPKAPRPVVQKRLPKLRSRRDLAGSHIMARTRRVRREADRARILSTASLRRNHLPRRAIRRGERLSSVGSRISSDRIVSGHNEKGRSAGIACPVEICDDGRFRSTNCGQRDYGRSAGPGYQLHWPRARDR